MFRMADPVPVTPPRHSSTEETQTSKHIPSLKTRSSAVAPSQLAAEPYRKSPQDAQNMEEEQEAMPRHEGALRS